MSTESEKWARDLRAALDELDPPARPKLSPQAQRRLRAQRERDRDLERRRAAREERELALLSARLEKRRLARLTQQRREIYVREREYVLPPLPPTEAALLDELRHQLFPEREYWGTAPTPAIRYDDMPDEFDESFVWGTWLGG